MRPLSLGTRESRLALVQSRWVADRLPCPVELIGITTEGDRSSAPIEHIGGTGVFVTALREALLRGEVDFVVHSFKDLPTAAVPGIRLAAVPERADPRDALIGAADLHDLPAGARVGTGSPRRGAQVRRALGGAVRIVPMRGNVDTRLRKLADGQVDALILAMAGLDRLGLPGVAAAPLDPLLLMPAPGQGALAVECRADDDRTAALLEAVDHPPSGAMVAAERGMLATLNAGCTAPIGALAWSAGAGLLRLDGLIDDGVTESRGTRIGPMSQAAALGRDLAHELAKADVVLSQAGR